LGLGLVVGSCRKNVHSSDHATPKKAPLASHYCSVEIEILQGVAPLYSRVTHTRSSISVALLRPP
jgi:hypothetical protein